MALEDVDVGEDGAAVALDLTLRRRDPSELGRTRQRPRTPARGRTATLLGRVGRRGRAGRSDPSKRVPVARGQDVGHHHGEGGRHRGGTR